MKHLFLFLWFCMPFYAHAQSQPSVLINEVMANPKGLVQLPETEYVELYNTTSQAITLTGWWFVYNNTQVRISELILPPNGYLVLYRAGRIIEVDQGGLSMPLEKFPYQLSNEGKLLRLYDADWNLQDEVYYPKAYAAISWERCGNEWITSGDERGGTPGSRNSCEMFPEEGEGTETPDEPETPILPENPEEPNEPVEIPDEPLQSFETGCVWINEVMANPKGLTALPETEYVELYNRSDQPIPLTDWQFMYGDKPTILTPYVLPAHGYVVLYRAGREIQVASQGGTLPLEKFPSALLNDGKTLALFDPSGNEIDRISYEKAKAAVAWERDETGLYLSTDPQGGTPGAPNSLPASEPEEEPEQPQTPEEPTEPSEPETPQLPEEPDTPVEPITPAVTYEKGCVWINEIMADPSRLEVLPQTEYVELHNRSDQPISLQDWCFVYGEKETRLTACSLPAKGYAVLYRMGREIVIDADGCDLPLADFPSALLNSGKELALRDPSGKEIDHIYYEKAKAGIAWERDETGLHLSTDPRGGTPGSRNTLPQTPDVDIPTAGMAVQPGELIFNELLPAPYTDGSEYIELYNRSKQLLSLTGLAIATRKADNSLSTLYPLSSITTSLEPGEYVLISKLLSGVEAFYLIASPQALHELKLPVLANNGATLVLLRMEDLVVIDEVSYTPKWHDSAVKEPKGVALERIDPDKPTQSATNWHSAAASAGYGTPGYRNSQQILPSSNYNGFERPDWSESERSYLLRYQLADAGYRCRIWVFDTKGRRIAEIANLTTLGTEGTLRWDGIGQDGNRLQPGLYIFHAELFLPDGTTQSQRKVFLVH